MIWNLLLEGETTTPAPAPEGNSTGTIIMLVVFAVVILGIFVCKAIANKKKRK